MTEPRRGRPARRAGFVLLVLATLALHGLMAERVAQQLGTDRTADAVPRLQAAFVRELQPTAPPSPAAPAAPPPPRRASPAKAPAAAPAASAPEPPAEPASAASAASAPEPEPAAAAAVAEPAPTPPDEAASAALAEAPAASGPEAPASSAAAGPAASAADGAPAFVWPASTRLSYTLEGDVRGEVHGTAQVTWLHDGDRYQVHLDVVVGPGFAPILQRRMTSDGTITAHGLVPRRYDEETRIAFGSPRRAGLRFDDEGVVLANGQRHPGLPALQDTASQFVQLTYLFATGAEPLRAGGRVEMPLALPKRVDRWVYDVIGEEVLETPFGRLPAWHLRPQREGDPSTLSIEAWFAPSLQYLPVRIVIRQGREHHVDLMIERLPLQADDGPTGGSALH